MATENAPQSMYRAREGLGVWEHRGEVAAVGIGHGPTSRRWDGKADTSVGAISLLALRKAIEDAGVNPEDIDGLVMDELTTTGAFWPAGQELPWDVINAYNQTDAPLDGITQLSAEWILKNMPELTRASSSRCTAGSACRTPSWSPPRRSARGARTPASSSRPGTTSRAATTRPAPTPRTPYREPPPCVRYGAHPRATARPSSSPNTAASTASTTT